MWGSEVLDCGISADSENYHLAIFTLWPFHSSCQAIAKALNIRVFVRDDKFRVLNCLEDDELKRMLTRSNFEARLHVLPMHLLNKRSLSEYLRPLKSRYDNVLALKPTGWTFEDQGNG